MPANKIKTRAISFILLLGYVSLFSDMNYEAARSIKMQAVAAVIIWLIVSHSKNKRQSVLSF